MDMSPDKAAKILHDGSVQGHKLTDAQRRMFGAIVSKGKKKKEQRASYARLKRPTREQ